MTTVIDLLSYLKEMGVEPCGVSDDSRHVVPGDLFLAYPGNLTDGRQYISDAIKRGAVAVCWQPSADFVWNSVCTVANVSVEGLRSLAGAIAHAVYGYPSEGLSLVAITGTNGKTTVSQFVAQAYQKPCAVIGTLGAGFLGSLVDTGLTTPEAMSLMRYLAEFRQAGAAACALEASSIGIVEGRINGARVDVAVFTNLTRDHLDYHRTMEAYAAAKEKLFLWPRLRTAIINLDDKFGRQLFRETSATRILGYAIGELDRDFPALVRAEELINNGLSQQFSLVLPNGRAIVKTELLGRYNISNLLAVAAVLHDAGLSAEDVARKVSMLTPPAGRMTRVGGADEPLVAVDYAHTPDALGNALGALREITDQRNGKLLVVFGCGGGRDKGKRPEMGRVAVACADQVMVTSDNPRNENPLTIIQEIIEGLSGVQVEVNRALAIKSVIDQADACDVILLAGKGHEAYQETAGVRVPFSDIEEAQRVLEQRQLMSKVVTR